jgi:translocation and assembly module TamA
MGILMPCYAEFSRILLFCTGLMMSLVALPVFADQLDVELNINSDRVRNSTLIEGLESNIKARVSAFRFVGADRLSYRRIKRLAEMAERQTVEALRPFGYYHSVIETHLQEAGTAGAWLLKINVNPAQPVVVSHVEVRLLGPGSTDRELAEWRRNWPLKSGAVLDQVVWEAEKSELLNTAESRGYFSAKLVQKHIALDLKKRTAELTLTLETGERSRFRGLRFENTDVDPKVLAAQPRFSNGDFYSDKRLSDLRDDLTRTGWFDSIEIREQRDPQASPPVVDLVVSTEPRLPNTYQTTVGFGTDTGPRVQFDWQRHLISPRGDNLRVGFGYQQENDEYVLQGEYRLPRTGKKRQYWVANTRLLSEQDSIKFLDEDTGETELPAIDGTREQAQFRFGRAALRPTFGEHEPILETVFVEWLTASFDTDKPLPVELPFSVISSSHANPSELLEDDTQTLSLGVRMEWPEIRGKGFDISGHHEQVQFLGSSDSLVSDISYWQAWLSSRWEHRLGERFKVIARAEAGYTSADVNEFTVDVEGETVNLSLTELPSEYRFRAGGDRSVRGYGYEELSNNRFGSNHILAASAELEIRLTESLSSAVFFDIGNAFNDWDDTNLKSGVGVGVRWYTVAGPLRLDFAKALDRAGEPWSIHFTIGSILL